MNGVLEQANSIGKAFVAFAGPMLIQSSVLILILLLADRLLRRRVRAVLRYWIWMLILIKLVLPTSLSLPMSLGYWFGDKLGFVEADQTIRIPQPRRIPVRGQAAPLEPVSAGPTEPAPVPRPEHAPAEPVNPPRVSLTPLSWRGAVFLAWLAVVTAMASLLLQRAIFVRGLVARARAADSSMKDIQASCCERMAVKRKVGLKVSPNASSPAVCGLFHPVILVPENLAPNLGSKRLRAVLMHELTHIKRGDLWVNLAQTLLQIVYFYNPLLWLANAIIRRVREQAVDEAVLVAMGQAAQQYPQTLVEVAKLTFEQPALSLRLIGVVESKDALAGRIKHILNRPIPKTAKLGLLGLLVVILAAVILLPMAKSQHRATWPDKDLLVKFVEAQPGPPKTISSPTKTTHVKGYDVEFAPGEELLVVAELYQAGKRMRLLGKEIFAGSTKPQKLTVTVCRAYKNESRTVFSHGAKVRLGGQVFEVPEFTVDVDRFYNDEGWGSYHGDGLRRLTNRLTKKDYAKLETLFYYRCSDGGGLSPGEARFWIPGHPITQVGSHHWIELKMMPLSRLNYLVLEPLAGQQGLDGKIIPADLTGEQARTIADKYKKMLIEEVEGQYDNSLYQKQGSIRYALEFIGTPEDIIDTTYVRRVGGQLASPQQLEFANKLFSVRKSKDVDVFVSLLSDGTKKQLNDGNNSRMLHHHIKKIKEGKFIHGEYDSNFFATFLKLTDEDINNLEKHVSFAESPTHRIVYWWCHHYQVCGKSFYLIEDKGSYKLVTQTLLSGQIIPATKDQTAGPKEYGITAFKQNDEAYSKPGSWKYQWDIELTPEVSKDNVFQLLKTTKVISGRDDLHPQIAAQKIIDESEIEKYKFDILKCRCYVAPSEPSKHNRKLSGWVCGLSIASWFKSKVMLLPGKDVTNIKPNKQGNFVGSDLELLTFETSQESTKYEHKLILRKSDSPEDKSAALLRLKQMMRRQISYAKLHYLNRILTTYANDHNSIFPHRLEQIKPYDTDEWLDWLLENVEYLGKGITHSEKSESKVALAYDKALLEKTGSTNVLFNRSSVPVEYCEPAKLEEIGITIDRKTAVQVETDKGREMRSNADARISFISADEGEEEKNYRWGVTRTSPLKVIQGWYEFDEGGIRSHGGGGRKIAETRPMQLTLRVSKENGFLVLHRGYAWSSAAGDQQADVGCKIEWPAGAVLKTYYLSEPVELTDKLQPVWKGELVQDSKVSKSVVYAVRVVGQNVSDELFDASDTSEALRIGRAWAPSPDPAKKRYEGRTIEQWIAQWDSRSYDDTRAATEALTRIGRPAVPAMIELMKKGGNPATRARTVLGNMGPQAEQALDWLIATALDRKPPAAQDKRRINAVLCLSYMTWASDRLMPVFAEIAEDRQADTGVRRVAISGLQRIGGEAMPILQKIADSEQGEIRDSARRALSERLAKEGVLSRQDYYTQLVEEDPFDPSVPKYLTSAKGIVNYGKTHALTNKVKAMYRQRLKENPDPGLAWRLAAIIQNGLRSTELEWAAPTDSSRSKWNREDPAESFATLAEVLELGFSHAEPRSGLWLDLGVSLAKLRLLQGNWDEMNATLKKLGQEPVPEESRQWLPAPPVDWSVGLRSQWQIADASMRSGNCSLEFRVEKDGKGLKGAHVLVKRAPEPTRVFRTGIAVDTLFYAPHPVESYRDSFGYRGSDREETRYAVSGESGIVRFDGLPDIPIKIEVLVPTANFAEAGSSWDLWMEVEPGRFKIAKIYGADAVSPRTPPAVVTLKSGQTVRYPKLVVRPAFGLNIEDWDRADKDNLVLSWQGLSTQPQETHYELEMSLSTPSQDPGYTEAASLKVESTKQILTENQWPVGSKGVDGMRLEPGNIYMFEVKAVEESGTVVARWPKTRVWVPWGYRQSHPPTIERDLRNNSPIYNGIWFRGRFSYGDGREETLPERVSRFLRERPDAFEHEYVRMGKAWLDWHAGDVAGARKQLERLARELPSGNLARGTAVWLLQQMDDNREPPKRLQFVPDRGAGGAKATAPPDEKADVQVEVDADEVFGRVVDNSVFFTPPVTRLVNDAGERRDCLIDFDNNKLLSPPSDFYSRDHEQQKLWTRENGVDATATLSDGAEGLWGEEMVVIPVANVEFDRMTPASFRELLAGATAGTPAVMTAVGELPKTYVFKTREGSMGLLRILEVQRERVPRHIRIRYKMVPRTVESDTKITSNQKVQDLGKAMVFFAQDHDGTLPDSLQGFAAYLRNKQDIEWLRQNVEYLGKGITEAYEPDTVIAYDKSLLELGQGTNVLFLDAHVEYVQADRLEKLGIKPSPKTHVQAEYGGPGSKLEFRVAPDTTSAELSPEEIERYKKDLAENGPVDSRRRGDKLAWFEIKSGVTLSGPLIIEECEGNKYLLLHNNEPFAMRPEQGWGLQKVEITKDRRGNPGIELRFDQKGSELFYKLTKANLRKALAIILNGKVVSAPTIESAIRKRAVITGTFTEQEVQQMLQALQRGLPPVKMGEQTGIDPTDRSAEFARLHEQLKSEDSRQREDAARKLGQLRDTRAVDALIAALKDGEVAVRAAAARALGKIGDKRAVEPLIEAYQEQNYESFVDTLWALGDIGGTRAEQMLVAALNYQGYHPYVRNIAAKNLERLGWKPANRQENMRFLIALERWEEAIKAGPAASLKPVETNQAEGPVEVSIPIVIALQAEKQTPAISKYPQIEFSPVDGRLKATLYIRYASWPHTKWIMRLELLDGGGRVLGQTERVHSNTGTIETYPHVERAPIAFEFDRRIGLANASRFRFSIESIWTSRGNPLQFDKELPLALELNAVEQPRTISTRWIKFENEGDNVRSTIHLKYLSWPKSKWEIRATLLGANGKQLSDARAIVENSGTVFGLPNSTEKDLQFWLGKQAVAGEGIRYVVTIQKILESNEMPAQPAFG